jgi:hypothetical protein
MFVQQTRRYFREAIAFRKPAFRSDADEQEWRHPLVNWADAGK